MVAPSSGPRWLAWTGRAVLSIAPLNCLAAGWNDRFDPVTRAKMILALLGVTVLGIGTIVMVVLGGRFIRRRIQVKPTQASRIFPSDWPDRPRAKPPGADDENE